MKAARVRTAPKARLLFAAARTQRVEMQVEEDAGSAGWQTRIERTIRSAGPRVRPSASAAGRPRFEHDDLDGRFVVGSRIDPAERKLWRRLSAERYVRAPREYVAPPNDLIIVSHEVAATVRMDDQRPFKDLPAIWRAVRGSDYARASDWKYGAASSDVYAELVPLPGNPHDGTALGVDLDERQVGYVPATYAEHAHWRIRQLNVLGYRVFVSGVFMPVWNPSVGESTVKMFVALPTFGVLDAHTPSLDEMIPRFRELWDSLPASRQARIADQWFSIEDEDMDDMLRANRAELALAIPTLPIAEALPFYSDLALRDLREEASARKAEERRARDEAIVQLAEQGMTAPAIATQVGLSAGTVRRIVSEAGLSMRDLAAARRQQASDAPWEARTAVSPVMRNGMSEQALLMMRGRIARCMGALDLQRRGMTYTQIGAELGASADTVQRLVQDARFYESPPSDGPRLSRARQMRADPVRTADRSKAEQRSVSDGSVLDDLYDGWFDDPSRGCN